MKIKKIVIGIIALGMFANQTAFAKAERLQIKDADRRAKEHAAKAQIKNIDLKNIEDPEARRAIREIFNYLNLQTQK
jgi:DNA invertase Pin-like site-specific DNA recombinase